MPQISQMKNARHENGAEGCVMQAIPGPPPNPNGFGGGPALTLVSARRAGSAVQRKRGEFYQYVSSLSE